jgi:single-strand DNA-binding protein
MSDNAIFIGGNVTKDPELKFLTGGQAKATFSVATNRRYQVQGEWREEATFHNVVVWRKLAENACATLKKGDRVVVHGYISTRSYEAADGQTKYITEISADEISVSLKYATADITRNPREDGASEYRKPAAASTAAASASDDPFAADEPF